MAAQSPPWPEGAGAAWFLSRPTTFLSSSTLPPSPPAASPLRPRGRRQRLPPAPSTAAPAVAAAASSSRVAGAVMDAVVAPPPVTPRANPPPDQSGTGTCTSVVRPAIDKVTARCFHNTPIYCPQEQQVAYRHLSLRRAALALRIGQRQPSLSAGPILAPHSLGFFPPPERRTGTEFTPLLYSAFVINFLSFIPL